MESANPRVNYFGQSLAWAGEDKLVLKLRDNRFHHGTVFVFQMKEEKLSLLWKKAFGTKVSGLAANEETIFLTKQKSGVGYLNLLNIQSGELRKEVALPGRSISLDEMGDLSDYSEEEKKERLEVFKKIKFPPHILGLYWLANKETLVAASTTGFYTWNSERPEKISVEESPNGNSRIHTSNGEAVLLGLTGAASQTEGCLVYFEPEGAKLKVIHGEKGEGPTGGMHTPRLSLAFAASEERYVRIGSGLVYVHEGQAEPKEWNFGNGSTVDLDWKQGLLAISGASGVLRLHDLEGTGLGTSEQLEERVIEAVFSPSGKQVATLGYEGQIAVFELEEEVGK